MESRIILDSENGDSSLYVFLRILNCLLILAHGVILWILTMNTIKYLKQFGKQKDPYTVATLLLLGASTTSLFFMLPWNILQMINTQAIKDWSTRNYHLIFLMLQIPLILANGFFSLALAVNSTKWANLVVNINFQEHILQPYLFKLIKIGTITTVCIMTCTMIYHSVIHCLYEYGTITEINMLITAKYLDIGTQALIGLWCMLVYITAYIIYVKYVKNTQDQQQRKSMYQKQNALQVNTNHLSTQSQEKDIFSPKSQIDYESKNTLVQNESFENVKMMRRLFLTISFVIVSRTLIIMLVTSDNQIVDQLITMAGFILNIVLILTLSWSIRDSVNKMRQHEENYMRATILRKKQKTFLFNQQYPSQNEADEVIEIDNGQNEQDFSQSSLYEGNSSLNDDDENAMKFLGSRIDSNEINYNLGTVHQKSGNLKLSQHISGLNFDREPLHLQNPQATVPAPSSLMYYQNMAGADYLQVQKQNADNSKKLLLIEEASEKIILPNQSNRLTISSPPNSYSSSHNKKQPGALSNFFNRISNGINFRKKSNRLTDGESHHQFLSPNSTNQRESAMIVQSVNTSIQGDSLNSQKYKYLQ